MIQNSSTAPIVDEDPSRIDQRRQPVGHAEPRVAPPAGDGRLSLTSTASPSSASGEAGDDIGRLVGEEAQRGCLRRQRDERPQRREAALRAALPVP